MNIDFKTLHQVIENLNVGIVVLNKENQIILFNRKAGEFLQQDHESRLGSSILRCHPERAEPGVLKMIDQLKSGELSKYEGWVNFAGRYVYEYIYPLRNDAGEYIATVSEIHDGAERAEYLKDKGDWKAPEMHGTGASSPRTPFP
ncbi:MAG: PAS domain-containing protein [Candidatus Odinarchaeota archaeon]